MARRPLPFLLIVLLAAAFVTPAAAQKHYLRKYAITSPAEQTLPPSNSVSKILTQDSSIWIGTGNGLAKSLNGGRSWISYKNNPAFADEGIFALSVTGGLVFAATGHDEQITDGSVQTGSGYSVSLDSGRTWTHLRQTLDARGDSIFSYNDINDSVWMLPVVVPQQNVTFDISIVPGIPFLTPTRIWIASWASGLRYSEDTGKTWKRVLLPPGAKNSISDTDTLWTTVYAPNDTLHLHPRRVFQHFDPRHNNNLLGFAVHAIDYQNIWCGTAGGVNYSPDGGTSWIRFNHQNELKPILGNWVIAIDHQNIGNKQRVWTTNWKAEDPNEDYGVSFTDDTGKTWTNIMNGIKAYDFAFKGSTAYIASDNGLYRTTDGGATFTIFSTFSDPQTREIISGVSVYAVRVMGDTVFAGTGDGMVSTIDNATHPFGSSWTLFRTYQPSGTTAATYSYPNPFSPGLEITRIHYGSSASGGTRQVSIDIFDFGMSRVRTLLHNASRDPNREYDEIWDGKTDGGVVTANGVYFYRIKIDNEDPRFGKIIVLQ